MDREFYFGEINNGEMELSEIGGIVADEWCKTEKIRPNIELDEWIIMPNHLHGIVVITGTITENETMITGNDTTMVETPRRGVSTVPTQPPIPAPTPPHPTLKPNSLGSIIGQFKSVTTNKFTFAWQPRFHDRIIRDQKSLNQIRKYIIENPLKWERDRNNAFDLYM